MDIEKTGRFIAELRRERGLTQRGLAERLNITDKAVSKWERGLSYPDITLLPDLAEALGVSAGELLNGERSQSSEKESKTISNALDYARDEMKRKSTAVRHLATILTAFAGAAAILICILCDYATSGSATWSHYTTYSIGFGLVIALPAIYGGRMLWLRLNICILAVFPYLAAMQFQTDAPVFAIGAPCAAIAIIYLWVLWLCSFFIFKTRKLRTAALACFAAIPTAIAINTVLALILNEPHDDSWDLFGYAVLGITGITMLVIDKRKNT